MINTIKVGTSTYSIVPVLSPYDSVGRYKNPLRITNDDRDENNEYVAGLTIGIGSGLAGSQYDDGICIQAIPPLVADNYGLKLKLNSPALKVTPNGLALQINPGLMFDEIGALGISLKDPAGPLATTYGLELLISSDVYTDGGMSVFRSLSANSYGLHLRLSSYTATHTSDYAIHGNALYPTAYGLSLRLGTSLTVDDDALYVKLSEYIIQTSGRGGTDLLSGRALAVVSNEGDSDGLTLRLHARNIGGIYKSLLTITDNGLDIDTEALKTVLGLS